MSLYYVFAGTVIIIVTFAVYLVYLVCTLILLTGIYSSLYTELTDNEIYINLTCNDCAV